MRKRLSYANVTATLALVFAMSGGALAANHYAHYLDQADQPEGAQEAHRESRDEATEPTGSAARVPTGHEG